MVFVEQRKRPIVQVAIAFGLFIALLIVLADTRHLGPLGLLYDFPYGDKAGHFLLYGLLTLLINLAVFQTVGRVTTRIALQVSGAIGIAVSVEELSQILFPSRSPDWFDLLSGLAGIVVFTWLALRIARWRRSTGLGRE